MIQPKNLTKQGHDPLLFLTSEANEESNAFEEGGSLAARRMSSQSLRR